MRTCARVMMLVVVAFLGTTSSAVPQQDKVYTTPPGPFLIPFRIDPDRKSEVAELRLYVSRDQGQGWKRAAKAKPHQTTFSFNATEEGEYWFSVQTVKNDGERFPKNAHSLTPALKMNVKAGAKWEYNIAPPLERWQKDMEEWRARVRELEERLKKLEQKELASKGCGQPAKMAVPAGCCTVNKRLDGG